MNFFDDIKVPATGEVFKKLFENKDILIEKIISSSKQNGKLYKQNYDEWIILMEGEASLQIDKKEVILKKGDFLLIEKDTPHRVVETASGTLWLCVHVGKS